LHLGGGTDAALRLTQGAVAAPWGCIVGAYWWIFADGGGMLTSKVCATAESRCLGRP
jgi:hypothetical protein